MRDMRVPMYLQLHTCTCSFTHALLAIPLHLYTLPASDSGAAIMPPMPMMLPMRVMLPMRMMLPMRIPIRLPYSLAPTSGGKFFMSANELVACTCDMR